MTKIIGMEYLIGNAFIHLTKERFIKISDIYRYRLEVQRYLNSNNMDAIISVELNSTLYCEDYFEIKKDAGLIILNKDVSKEALQERFVWRLPDEIAKSFEVVAQNLDSKITEKEIEAVKRELKKKRKEFERLNMSLEEKLNWLSNFFNEYVPELEKRYLTEEERKNWVFLPDELRIHFYLIFPEHGLNMAKFSESVSYELAQRKRFDINNAIAFRHQD